MDTNQKFILIEQTLSTIQKDQASIYQRVLGLENAVTTQSSTLSDGITAQNSEIRKQNVDIEKYKDELKKDNVNTQLTAKEIVERARGRFEAQQKALDTQAQHLETHKNE